MSLFDLIDSSFSSPFIMQYPQNMHPYPILVSSPHSGMQYDTQLLSLSRLSIEELRKSEDSYVHLLCDQFPQLGVTLLQATLPRIFCDLNREAWELDPDMFKDRLPDWCNQNSYQVKRGFGTVHKISALGRPIYKYYLSFPKIYQRIETYWFSYHQQIQQFIQTSCDHYGGCILLDVHSMPSMPKRSPYYTDIVLGDGFAQTCSSTLINNSQKFFTQHGLKVSKNTPYAGGYITRHYGNPKQNIHTMQIEINKSLYMKEDDFEMHGGFTVLQSILIEYIKWICLQKTIFNN
ncbi:N-formylglutamate amidohydrolase [Commensalibacter papalotli (ex Servin-Garciduenas et al. 2014)]|uniref:N-formylglutamate amidohydrolase n=1 Tax=Commensalibacter papalotli (ex Servin-Garciduenas et al. 2014) TaxID=1208583 RepID=W7E0X7_9PROT|nr:N-formylglutamate amidohydrolase [Commensalibacter papalotli (ex Servin-Garciduenas et al. 2014)]EUK18674.1 N-formylglutamate amidohydrolase [Commensalibacter papalotli (ex Servin-Garciduenas et al. 2014)]